MHLDPAKRNVLLLAVCQALFATSNAVVVTASALAGQQMAPDPALATLPFSLQFVATMLLTYPMSMLMRRAGRRFGFMLGALFALGSGLIGFAAIMAGEFWWFALAGGLYGGFLAAAGYYRFAAADVASLAYRPRAIAYVLAGGVVAALIGPELAKATAGLFAPVLFAGCYLAVAGLAVATLFVLLWISVPRPSEEERLGHSRPLTVILRQPTFAVAVLGALVGYGAMALLMTATPLAMVACGHAFEDAAFVIQWHILGMFAPSFFTGRLIARYGAIEIMMVGGLALLVAIGVNLSGVEVVQFWIALFLLGLGWNFLFIGATTLVTTTYRPAEKAKVQAINDLVIVGTVALASLSSGALQHLVGWSAVNLGVAPPLLIALVGLIWLRQHRRRTAQALPAQ